MNLEAQNKETWCTQYTDQRCTKENCCMKPLMNNWSISCEKSHNASRAALRNIVSSGARIK